jgi:hypothetical protein
MNGEEAAAVARGYSDVEIEPFFESSDDDVDPERTTKGAKGDVSVMPSEEAIAGDLARIAAALEQQPYRASAALGLQRMLRHSPSVGWLRLARAERERVQRTLEDMGLPAVLGGLVDHWGARERWRSSEALLHHYASLPVVATRLVPVGEMGKSQKVFVSLASYLRYCETTEADFPLYVFDYDLPSSVLRHDYAPPPLDCFKRDLFDPEAYPDDFPRDSLGFFNKMEYVILGSKGTGSPLHKVSNSFALVFASHKSRIRSTRAHGTRYCAVASVGPFFLHMSS